MIILLIISIAVAILFFVQKNKLSQKVEMLEQEKQIISKEVDDLNQLNSILNSKNSELSKYEGITDVQAEAERIMGEALSNSNDLLKNAEEELLKAKNSATEVRKNANAYAEQQKNQCNGLIESALKEYDKIVGDATKKAEEIAGDAYKALQNVSELEKAAKALKNKIDGYGDEYLIPTYSLLDDLADEFKHTQAGENLKLARTRTFSLVKASKAAKCDYVESNRKETAINFVVDAFNGKVDSILSKVKMDNYGILEQKIKDAYHLVNLLGKAFRNAMVTEEFLNARLDELKWAVITQELKWKEQEEQRLIKEQIREEEKARKEYERAIKEAQKEEEALKKLIEKAQQQVQQSNDEERRKFELRLLELEGKLKIAEEKNQRALSMAQQTKSGNVYVISNIGSFGENVYKIGMTRRLEPLDRIRELGDASVPFEFDVHALIYSDNAPALEKELHRKFLRMQINKVNPRKEFFRVGINDIKDEIEKMNIEAKWTMVAAAIQYKESLNIEKTIANDKVKEKEWENYQNQVVATETEEELAIN